MFDHNSPNILITENIRLNKNREHELWIKKAQNWNSTKPANSTICIYSVICQSCAAKKSISLILHPSCFKCSYEFR